MGRWRTFVGGVGALMKWAAAGAVLGLAAGAIWGLLTGTLWVLFTGDLTRAMSRFWLSALAGTTAGLIVAVVAWWERPESKVEQETRIIVARMAWDGSAESKGLSDLEDSWTRSAQASEPFSDEARGRKKAK
jgi:hypothetical protein